MQELKSDILKSKLSDVFCLLAFYLTAFNSLKLIYDSEV